MRKSNSSTETKRRKKSPADSKPATASSGRERMRAYRERMRAAGYRPVQHWVLDLRNPKIAARIKREIARLDKHPEAKAIDDWIEAVTADLDWT